MPAEGPWFQLIANGTTIINLVTNGLPRLDKVVELAEQHGIYLLLSLTNNWNPIPGSDANAANTLNRNYLSNDYG